MSLKIWLPLKGDLHNQGSSKTYSTQTTGYTIASNGKIGSCIKFSSVFDTQIPIEDWDYVNKSVSLCCWAKISKTELETLVNSYSYDNRYSTAGGTLIGRDSYGGFSIRWKTNNIYNDGQLEKIYAYTHIRNTSTNQNTTTEYEVPFDIWFHVVAILDRENSKLYFYVNGNLVANSNFTITGTFSTGTFLIAQASWDGGNGMTSSGAWMLNDVRVYDHCLSALEVKEIAQGLVLHYPLNDKYIEDTINYLGEKGNTFTSWGSYGFGSKGTITIDTTQTAIYGGQVAKLTNKTTETTDSRVEMATTFTQVASTVMQKNEKFTISAWVKGNGATIGKSCFLHIYNSNGTDTSSTSGSSVTLTGQWQYITYTYTWPYDNASSNNGNCYVCISMKGGESAYICNVQVEKKDHATPFTINTRSSNIIYDCSGYCNNGEKIGDLIIKSDTPRYDISTHISATNQKIHISNFPTSGFGNSYSFSWWGKRDSNSPMFWGFSDGIRLNGMYAGTLWNTGDSNNNPIYQPGTTTTITAPSTNAWHHYVMTGDGTTCKLYVDGVLYGQAKTYKAISGTSIYINGWDSSTSYSSTNTDISDFRIYATALSAEDIKALYETSMSIDNFGQIHGFNFDESSESQIQSIGKNGIINCKELIEDDGAHFYENGSIEANNFIEK